MTLLALIRGLSPSEGSDPQRHQQSHIHRELQRHSLELTLRHLLRLTCQECQALVLDP
jgi:hypothetical protein